MLPAQPGAIADAGSNRNNFRIGYLANNLKVHRDASYQEVADFRISDGGVVCVGTRGYRTMMFPRL
jgi:hypothetical protein